MTSTQQSLSEQISKYKPVEVISAKGVVLAEPPEDTKETPVSDKSFLGTLDPADASYYEKINAGILDHYKEQGIQTIAITSACSGEGTTTTAINLASTLANNFRFKVLLMDMNFRKQGRHYNFESDQDRNCSDMDNLNPNGLKLRKLTQGRLTVVAFDCDALKPVQSFSNNGLTEFLDKQKENHDFIILDSPPVNEFPDTGILSSLVDAVVLVVDSGKTRGQVIARSREIIEKAGGNIVGVVLNKTRRYIPEWIYRRL